MGSGAFKLPTGEHRFSAEHVSIGEGQKLYIDPSIWCIHGEYEAFDSYILTKSNVTAHLAQVHPFTLGWLGDLHSPSSIPKHVREQIDRLSRCNPTLTVFGGDIVSGSGEYLGSDMEDGWFQNVWDYAKNKLSDHLWVKGNHDIDPNRYFYYNWFERLWTLRVGRFKFVGFDGYNEQSLIPGSCEPCLSLPDVLWLRRRLTEDELDKVILVHQPLEQWFPHAPWAFKDVLNIKCVYSGHSHDVIYIKGPYKEISEISNYINGSCSKEVQLRAATLTVFTKDGKEQTVLVTGDSEVKETTDGFEITAQETMNWKKERVKSVVPFRLVRRLGQSWLNLIVFCPSETSSRVRIVRQSECGMELISDSEMYIVGKGIVSEQAPYDSWKCSCGAIWNSYRSSGNEVIKLKLSS